MLAPAIAPVAYTKAVPYNVLPFANSVNVFTKVLSPPVVAAYGGFAPAIVKSHVAPLPAVASAFAPVSAFGHVPAAAPALAHAPAVVPSLRVSSLLPAPFAAAPGVFPAAPVAAAAAPVVRSVGPFHLGPAPIASPHPVPAAFGPVAYANPYLGRSVHAVAPAAFASSVVPAVAPAPNW